MPTTTKRPLWKPDYPMMWVGDDTPHLIYSEYLKITDERPGDWRVEVEDTSGNHYLAPRQYVVPREGARDG